MALRSYTELMQAPEKNHAAIQALERKLSSVLDYEINEKRAALLDLRIKSEQAKLDRERALVERRERLAEKRPWQSGSTK